jgi:hypothetical protein
MEIDRQTGSDHFEGTTTAPFAVSKTMELPFIRIAQTDTNHFGYDNLLLLAVEFFAILSQ